MPYDEAKYLAPDQVDSLFDAPQQVMTASGAVVTSTLGFIPVVDRATTLNAAYAVQSVGIGSSYTLIFSTGTTTLASGVVTNTAGSSGVISSTSSAVIQAGGAVQITLVGTGTASATQVGPRLVCSYRYKQQFS